MKSQNEIVEEIIGLLRNNPSVCIDGSTHGYTWLRHHNNSWKLVKYGGEHRSNEYVDGDTMTESEAKDWIKSNPATVKSITEAGNLTDSDSTVWEDAISQNVFTDKDRCFWCGTSEEDTTITAEKTIEHDIINLCSDCKQFWKKAGELANKP